MLTINTANKFKKIFEVAGEKQGPKMSNVELRLIGLSKDSGDNKDLFDKMKEFVNDIKGVLRNISADGVTNIKKQWPGVESKLKEQEPDEQAGSGRTEKTNELIASVDNYLEKMEGWATAAKKTDTASTDKAGGTSTVFNIRLRSLKEIVEGLNNRDHIRVINASLKSLSISIDSLRSTERSLANSLNGVLDYLSKAASSVCDYVTGAKTDAKKGAARLSIATFDTKLGALKLNSTDGKNLIAEMKKLAQKLSDFLN